MANVPFNDETPSDSLQRNASTLAPVSSASMPQRTNLGNLTSRQQSTGLLMTHASGTNFQQTQTSTVGLGALNFGSRTAEQSRIFADNISTAFQEIGPLFEQARAVLSKKRNKKTNKQNKIKDLFF